MSPIDLAVAVSLVFLVTRTYSRLRAAAVRRAARYLLMLHRVAELTELRLGDTARLLGATPEQIPRWEATGVLAAWQPAVAELLRIALALRHELPSSITARLLTLRQRRATELEYLECLETRGTDLFRRFSPRQFVVTMRQ